ncbi:hypothetical protein Dda_0981 [Drechslerella dactyloides]|uniref:Uncharacterized protein n=1 Tax=Drechslerella dactyloides TaxID=74499 RepID=A0AAD6J748_DREDA|nr:hypothetical protein Dda_0981 [Drechslerella dactyloides]
MVDFEVVVVNREGESVQRWGIVEARNGAMTTRSANRPFLDTTASRTSQQEANSKPVSPKHTGVCTEQNCPGQRLLAMLKKMGARPAIREPMVKTEENVKEASPEADTE